MDAIAENRYWITIGTGLVVALFLIVYMLVTSRKKSGARKAAARHGRSGAANGAGSGGDGGASVYKDGPGMPQDNDKSVYRDSDLYGIKGDKKDKEEFYKDWD